MNTAVKQIANIAPFLKKLQEKLEQIKVQQFDPLSNYPKRLLAGKTVPTNAPIACLHSFFSAMREATVLLEAHEQNVSAKDVPVDFYHLYKTIRDSIYRAGKYEEGGVNQNPDGIRITQKNICLGNPPGTFKRDVSFILVRWEQYATASDKEKAVAYSIEAWNVIKNNFGLINKIKLFQKKIDNLSQNKH